MLRLRKINIFFWIIITIILMVCTYSVWSEKGSYTLIKFFSSLVFDGGFCLVLCLLIDENICNYYKNNK